MICGTGGGVGEGVTDGLGPVAGEAVVGVADAEAVALGDLALVGVADGELRRLGGAVGEATVTATGMMSDPGLVLGEADGESDGESEVTDRQGRVAVARGGGANCAADDGRSALRGARLTATDAATMPAATPAAVSGRHQRRDEIRPDGRATLAVAAVPATGFGAMYWANAPMGQPSAGRAAPASASTSAAVGRSAGSLA